MPRTIDRLIAEADEETRAALCRLRQVQEEGEPADSAALLDLVLASAFTGENSLIVNMAELSVRLGRTLPQAA